MPNKKKIKVKVKKTATKSKASAGSSKNVIRVSVNTGGKGGGAPAFLPGASAPVIVQQPSNQDNSAILGLLQNMYAQQQLLKPNITSENAEKISQIFSSTGTTGTSGSSIPRPDPTAPGITAAPSRLEVGMLAPTENVTGGSRLVVPTTEATTVFSSGGGAFRPVLPPPPPPRPTPSEPLVGKGAYIDELKRAIAAGGVALRPIDRSRSAPPVLGSDKIPISDLTTAATTEILLSNPPTTMQEELQFPAPFGLERAEEYAGQEPKNILKQGPLKELGPGALESILPQGEKRTSPAKSTPKKEGTEQKEQKSSGRKKKEQTAAAESN